MSDGGGSQTTWEKIHMTFHRRFFWLNGNTSRRRKAVETGFHVGFVPSQDIRRGRSVEEPSALRQVLWRKVLAFVKKLGDQVFHFGSSPHWQWEARSCSLKSLINL